MPDTPERDIRERIDNGDLFTIHSRYWPGGLKLDPIKTITGSDLEFFHSVAKSELDFPPWGAFAREVETGDAVYIIADGERANVSFGKAAARSGAFNPVYLDAFEFED